MGLTSITELIAAAEFVAGPLPQRRIRARILIETRDGTTASVAQAVAALPEIYRVTKEVGELGIVAEAETDLPNGLDALLDRIGDFDGVTHTRTILTLTLSER